MRTALKIALFDAGIDLTDYESGTNLITAPEDFSDASWVYSNCTLSVNSTTAPDGEETADSLVENSSSAQHRIYTSFSGVANTTYEFSIFIKPIGTDRNIYYMCQNGADVLYLHTDFSGETVNDSGASGNASYVSSSLTNVGEGWYRIKLRGIVDTASATYYHQIYFENTLRTGASPQTYTGNGTSGFYLWGAKLEEI